MQLALVAAFIPLANILWCGVSADDCNISNLLLELGYTQECIVSSLASLLISGKVPTTNECSLKEGFVISNQKNIAYNQTETKSELENITNALTELKTLVQNVIKVQENGKKNSDDLIGKLENIANALAEAKLERESDKKNSDAQWDIFANITKSQWEMNALLQEVKTEQLNEKKKCDKLPNSETSTTTASPPEELDPPKNCADLRAIGDLSSGVRTVAPGSPLNSKQVTVYCDQETDEGEWTVFQNRDVLPERVSFERSWQEYVQGFGDPKGEYWLGLDNLHVLTNATQTELRVDLEDWEGQKRWAKYETFNVGDASSKYVLSIAGYSGDAGNGMVDPYQRYNLHGSKFSTYDQDNDLHSDLNCAESYRGGWWFNSCSGVNLNGYQLRGAYEATHYEGIYWYPFRGGRYSLKKVSMKTRPVKK